MDDGVIDAPKRRATTAQKTTAQKTRAGASLRVRLLRGLAAVVVISGVGYGAYYKLVGANEVSTENAYVGADTAQITAQTAGIVVAVEVSDTRLVKAGDVLVRIDPADAKANLASTVANLDRTILSVKQAFANNLALEAQVAQRRSDLDRARGDYERRLRLADGGAVAREEIVHARESAEGAEAALRAAEAQFQSGLALTAGYTLETHPDVLRAMAQRDTAALDLSRTTLRAPVGGVVTRRSVQVGQRVSAGAALMMIVPIDALYVDANFKEVQLAKIRVGQKVALRSDLYGARVTFHGHVVGLSGGTGAAFALVPAQNATGNWIKVVQRVPVRIALDPVELARHPLRVGVTMRAVVDTDDRRGV